MFLAKMVSEIPTPSTNRRSMIAIMRMIVVCTASVLALEGCGGSNTSAPSTVTVHDNSTQASAPQAPAHTWKMPNEFGKDLQTAQDDIQSMTGNPLRYSSSTDLTGQGRHQINDRNWQVCTSTPAPDEEFTADTPINFGVVRINTEKCP